MKHLFCTILLSLSLIFLTSTGCSNHVPSRGIVKFEDGTPLSEGNIYFQDEYYEYFSQIKKDGSYSIWAVKEGDGLPPGKYRVYLSFPSYRFADEYPVDVKFTDPEKSEWVVDVLPGRKNLFDFTVVPNMLKKGSLKRPKTPYEPTNNLELK